MGDRLAKKFHVSRDVYDLSCERMVKVFKRSDTVVVWFSGGKDSTVVLHVAVDTAKALGKRVRVAFFDEEVIPPETVEYCDRVRQSQPVDFDWLCLPIKHRNACSSRFPWWYPFDPACPELWGRPIPPFGTVEADWPSFVRGTTMPLSTGMLYPPNFGTVCSVMGVRTQESLNRYQAIASVKRGHDAFFCSDHWKHVIRAYPIYDWATEDVWLAPEKFGWDYNRAYDVMSKAGIPLHNQRCAPPYGEQPLERLWTYHVCWPQLWDKMVVRVPGAATAGRYARTALYGYGEFDEKMKPESMTWRQFVHKKIAEFPAEDRALVAKGIKKLLDDHASRTREPMPEDEPHVESGLCWMRIAKLVIRGDIKGRKAIAIRAQANKAIEKAAQKKGKP